MSLGIDDNACYESWGVLVMMVRSVRGGCVTLGYTTMRAMVHPNASQGVMGRACDDGDGDRGIFDCSGCPDACADDFGGGCGTDGGGCACLCGVGCACGCGWDTDGDVLDEDDDGDSIRI